MDQNLQALRMQRHGFALVTSSYVDGCYADDDDTSQNWQKVCYGRALNFYASRLPALEADGQQLLAVFVQAGWRAGGPRSFSQSCFGYPLDILGGGSNPRITNNYELASVSGGCPYSLSQIDGDTVPIIEQPSVVYSRLTHTVDEADLTRRLIEGGYQSIITISAEKEYFDQAVGIWVFP